MILGMDSVNEQYVAITDPATNKMTTQICVLDVHLADVLLCSLTLLFSAAATAMISVMDSVDEH